MPVRSLLAQLRTANVLLRPSALYYAPDWVVLGVNNACNLHCRMCDVGVEFSESTFYRNLTGSTPLNMPIETVRRVVDQVARSWPGARIGFAFTEPLAYPPIAEAVRIASEQGLGTALTTNGLTLAGKAEGLCAAGLQELCVSLDGPPKVHNQIRGHAASFEKAIEGIRSVLEIGRSRGAGPEVSVFCTITPWNIGSLEEFLEALVSLSLSRVGIMHTAFVTEAVAMEHNLTFGLDYPATASNLSQLDLQAMDLERLWREIAAIESRTWPWPVTFSPRTGSRQELDIFYREPARKVGRRCNDVFSKMLVQSNGDVLPGAGRCYHVKLGNLHEQPLAAIWNGPPLAALRRTLVNEGGLLPACSRCCAAYG